jgi:hypothetical protein
MRRAAHQVLVEEALYLLLEQADLDHPAEQLEELGVSQGRRGPCGFLRRHRRISNYERH